MIVIGIAAGRLVEFPVSNAYVAYILLALLFLTALLRRWERVASVTLMGAFMVLGVFLIRNSDNNPTSSVSYVEKIAAEMREKRKALTSKYVEQGLSGDTYDIVAAMTLGEKKGISKEVRKTFSASGGAHILALSGMHLGILFMILTFLLPTKRWPKISVLIELLAIWAFVFLIGFQPSLVRAALMLTIYCIAKMLSRNTRSMDVLAFTAALLLVISPQWLFDVGFQMSFAAVTGILLLYGPIFRFLTYREKETEKTSLWVVCRRVLFDGIVGLVVISFTAQLGVAPLVAYYFGNFPTYFLLTNFIVTPAAFLIIVLAIGLLMRVPLLTPLTIVVQGMHASLLWIKNLPYSNLEVRLSVWQTLLVYVIIISLSCLVYLCIRKTDRFLKAMP
ncbi:MAG: ComEC/Rec2 family competence protein [Prevotella sp.]|nr:ComEC/Rec2 family competence protein [Prevotella sp.]